MSVGSIGSSTFNLQTMASTLASRIMKEADSDGSGTLDKTELTAFKTSKDGQGPDVDTVFSTYNQAGDGELTQSELQESVAAEGAKMQAGGGKPAGGPPPSAGTDEASGGTSSSTTVSTDPKDANKDGKVSALEDLTYRRAHSEPNEIGAKAANETDQGSSSGSPTVKRTLDISV